MDAWTNQLYFGDNLDMLREYVPDESVDLAYLDPPFNSQATYNVLFAEKSGDKSAAQIAAFEDTWHWGMESARTYQDMVTIGPKRLADLLQAMHAFLGQSDMMAYLTMMAPRLVELHRVLKSTGSLYLHCDPTASHYLKLFIDAVFGHDRFRNELVWQRAAPRGHAFTRYPSTHDIIFFYGKGTASVWHTLYLPHREAYIKSHYSHVEEGTGRRYQLDNCMNPNPNRPNLTYEWHGHVRVWRWTREKMQELHDMGRLVYTRSGVPRYKRYLDEMLGTPVTSLWTDIPPINSQAAERLGYPTQKPEALLERIIKTSSNEGDIILDPFCGCGTAIAVAERLHRRWIGIDVTHLAITLIKHRLHDTYKSDLAPYKVIGAPEDLASAQALAQEDRYQFEWWALGLVDARPAQDKKKGADKGVDGYIYFFDDTSGKAKKIVVQVKSGHVTATQIRDLKGTVQREQAEIGVFLTLEQPTGPMVKEATTTDFYTPAHFPGQYPRLQILTIADVLSGKSVQYPQSAVPQTFKRAERRAKEGTDSTLELFRHR